MWDMSGVSLEPLPIFVRALRYSLGYLATLDLRQVSPPGMPRYLKLALIVSDGETVRNTRALEFQPAFAAISQQLLDRSSISCGYAIKC